MPVLSIFTSLLVIMIACDHPLLEEEEEISPLGYSSSESSLLLFQDATRNAIDPKVAILPDGKRTVLWTDTSGNTNSLYEEEAEYRLYLSELTADGLSEAELLAGPSSSRMMYSSNLVDSAGRQMLTWRLGNDIFYRMNQSDPMNLGTSFESSNICTGSFQDSFYLVWHASEDQKLKIAIIDSSSQVEVRELYTQSFASRIPFLNCESSTLGIHVYHAGKHFLVTSSAVVESNPTALYGQRPLVVEDSKVSYTYSKNNELFLNQFDGHSWKEEQLNSLNGAILIDIGNNERIYLDRSPGGAIKTATDQTIFNESWKVNLAKLQESSIVAENLQLASNGRFKLVTRYQSSTQWSEPQTLFENGVLGFSTPLSSSYLNGQGLLAFSEYDDQTNTAKIRIKEFYGFPSAVDGVELNRSTCESLVTYSELESSLKEHCLACHSSSISSRAPLDTQENLLKYIDETLELISNGSMPPGDHKKQEMDSLVYKINCLKRSQ